MVATDIVAVPRSAESARRGPVLGGFESPRCSTCRATCASPPTTVNLRLVGTGAAPIQFLKWDLENAVIGSYRVGANTADTPADQFSIAFTALTYTYTAQDDKGGIGDAVTRTVTFE